MGRSDKAAWAKPQGTSRRNKFCMYHLQGVCKYAADECPYAHSVEDMTMAQVSRRQEMARAAPQSRTRGNPKRTCPTTFVRPLPGVAQGIDAAGPSKIALCQAFTSQAAGPHMNEPRGDPQTKLLEPMFVE